MNWSAIAAILLALGVAFGAFGAHALRSRLDAYSLGIWEKAVFYHFIHAFAILAVQLFVGQGLTHGAAQRLSLIFFAGILLFSGSLYALAISGTRALGAVTPIGGVAFLAGWLMLAFHLFRSR